MRKSFAASLLAAIAISAAAPAESATITLTEPEASSAAISGVSVDQSEEPPQTNSFSASTELPYFHASGTASTGDDSATASMNGEAGSATPNSISIPSWNAGVSVIPDETAVDLVSVQIGDNFSFTIDSATSFTFTGTQTITGSAADIASSGFGIYEGTNSSGTAIAVPDPSLSGPFSFSGTLAPGSYFLSAQVNLQDGTFNGVDAGSFQGSATFLINTPEPSSVLLLALGATGFAAMALRRKMRKIGNRV